MKTIYKKNLIYFVSISLFIYFFYFSTKYLSSQKPEIINFVDSEIHENFEIEITKNLDDINNFLKEYSFIESYLMKRNNNEISIKINLKKPFAINNLTEEVIFTDNTKAPNNYFSLNYLDNINLKDTSKKSIYINNYLNEYYQTLSLLFKIDQIEYIDERRYNLVLRNGRIVMLPKVIDTKLLYFIENNIDLIDKSTNYKEFLDLRNFHKKTIRLK